MATLSKLIKVRRPETALDYLVFHLCGTTPSGKTELWDVYASRNCTELLATISWYGPWRKYCFFPLTGSIYDPTCMSTLTVFLRSLMEERKHYIHSQPPVLAEPLNLEATDGDRLGLIRMALQRGIAAEDIVKQITTWIGEPMRVSVTGVDNGN